MRGSGIAFFLHRQLYCTLRSIRGQVPAHRSLQAKIDTGQMTEKGVNREAICRLLQLHMLRLSYGLSCSRAWEPGVCAKGFVVGVDFERAFE